MNKHAKDSKGGGWYYGAHVADFGGFLYAKETPNDGDDWYGPFPTFGAAKRDAIDFFQADIRQAKQQIQEIRAIKKKDIQ